MGGGGSDLREMMRLWGEVQDFPASETTAALQHLLASLGRILHARPGFAVVSVRWPELGDALDGWRVAWTELPPSRRGRDLERILEWGRDHAYVDDPVMRATARDSGRHRVDRQRELVGDEAWRRSELSEFLAALEVEDRLVGVHSVSPDVEVHLGVDRLRGDRPFGKRSQELMDLAVRGFGHLYASWVRTLGIAGRRRPLPPRHRATLQHLLRGLSEKEIAAELDLARSTVHQYVVAVYRHFGVRSRAELMALWLGQPAPAAGR